MSPFLRNSAATLALSTAVSLIAAPAASQSFSLGSAWDAVEWGNRITGGGAPDESDDLTSSAMALLLVAREKAAVDEFVTILTDATGSKSAVHLSEDTGSLLVPALFKLR